MRNKNNKKNQINKYVDELVTINKNYISTINYLLEDIIKFENKPHHIDFSSSYYVNNKLVDLRIELEQLDISKVSERLDKRIHI